MRITIVISIETGIVSALAGMNQVPLLTWKGDVCKAIRCRCAGRQFVNNIDLMQRARGGDISLYDEVGMDYSQLFDCIGCAKLRSCGRAESGGEFHAYKSPDPWFTR